MQYASQTDGLRGILFVLNLELLQGALDKAYICRLVKQIGQGTHRKKARRGAAWKDIETGGVDSNLVLKVSQEERRGRLKAFLVLPMAALHWPCRFFIEAQPSKHAHKYGILAISGRAKNNATRLMPDGAPVTACVPLCAGFSGGVAS